VNRGALRAHPAATIQLYKFVFATTQLYFVATELWKRHHDGQDKYTYFLLAAAGAAIGFALQKNTDNHMGNAYHSTDGVSAESDTAQKVALFLTRERS